MSSQAQIDANRLNAQKSTGPATDEGKAKSRFNALKHGAYAMESELTGDDPEKFLQRERDYFRHFQPKDVEETFHVKAMIAAENDHDRCCFLEAFTLHSMVEQQPTGNANPLGDAIVQDSTKTNALEKLARRKAASYARWVRSNKLLKQSRLDGVEAELAAAKAPHPTPNPQSHAPNPAPAAAQPTPVPNQRL